MQLPHEALCSRLAVRGVAQEDPEPAVLVRGVVLDLGVGVRRVADVDARLAVAARDVPRVDAVRGIELRDAVLLVVLGVNAGDCRAVIPEQEDAGP